ncbi:SsgA family sporulation/cell division regulator [Streptomyces triticagri]|uniref:SsgA family sporulation/cell division regulator n=1 Tax=Streptomyces triticagri TaxID=2293568 RepID=A0A372MCT5_9ACTN|nr:SsgA family sporulation/cell division regulator [Streptomyces triticagri]RFU88711.1 SsgA family sporulation/cell division regulator [Streptomyces triticagri]
MSVVEGHARCRVVTDSPEGSRAIRAALRYDIGADAPAVRIAFPGGHEWTCPRELLERGARAPAQLGEVQVWPCGRAQLILEFHEPDGVTVLQFDVVPLIRFLQRTYGAAAPSPSSV